MNPGTVARDYSRLAGTAFARSRLERVSAVVVGAGALGNEVVKNLALLGVGRLLIVDRDVVERSNLTRSILFCSRDIEQELGVRTPKAVLVSRRVTEINPDVEVSAIVAEIGDLGLSHLRHADVVFGCLDNELARLELGWACQRTNRLLVDGGLGWRNTSAGQVTLFPGSSGPCYACRKGPERRRELLQELGGREDPCWVKERAEPEMVATTPLTASTVAAVQVELGLRAALDGVDDPAVGRAWRVTLHPGPSVAADVFGRSSSCSLHDPADQVGSPRPIDGRSDVLTALALIEASERRDGRLVLDWPLTMAARCGGCGAEWAPAVRRARFRREGKCPVCGATDVIELDVLAEVGRESPHARTPLTALGLPPAHVHVVADTTGEGPNVHLEVLGDLASPWEPVS